MSNSTSEDVSKGYLGSIFVGLVLTSDASTYTHVVAPISNAQGAQYDHVLNATELSSMFSSILGFKQASLVQPGTYVLAYLLTPINAIILGAIPEKDVTNFYPARTIVGVGDAIKDAANRPPTYATSIAQSSRFNNCRPTDIVDGEYALVNEFGVMLGLFQQLATLKASELSQIQCHFLDDLVRIVSHNFEHYTALGEYKIYHDGKSLMAEFGATHIPQEGYGVPCTVSDTGNAPQFESGATTPKDDDVKDFFVQNAERQVAIERMKIFLGRLGDFVRIVFSKPEDTTLRAVDGKQINGSFGDTGLADFHVGTDGGLHIRSAKEVFIEKTNWIRVPIRVTTPDDPSGDDASKIDYPVKNDFKWDISQKNQANPFYFALQLRDYVAYMMSDSQAFANFKAHEKDFYVPAKPSDGDLLPNIDQVDQHTKVDNSSYQLRKAGIYMMPNGGITIKDAWDSAIIMEGGNIYLQASKDVVMQPMRNLIGKVGRNVSLAAQKDVDVSSTSGAFRLKTDLSQYFYSDNSGMVFEANPSIPIDTPPTNGPVEELAGMLFKINKAGSFVVKTANDFQVYAASGNFAIETRGLTLHATDIVTFQTDGFMTLTGTNGAFMFSENIASVSSNGTAYIGGTGSTLLGQKDQSLNIVAMFDKAELGIKALALDTAVFNSISTSLDSSFTPEKVVAFFNSPDKVDAFKFKFPSSTHYALDDSDGIPDTLANQGAIAGNGGLFTATWTENPVNDTLPFPGTTKFDTYLFTSEVKNLTTYSGNDLTEAAKAESATATLVKASLQQYKVSAI